jgi:hypothetical protein
MDAQAVVGAALVAGFVLFMIGAVAWRLEYERPLAESLVTIHGDRGRRAWIHVWMLAAMLVTPAGLAGAVLLPGSGTAAVLTAMAFAIYALGAVCWMASLCFRLAVVPWAAEQTVVGGAVPEGFAALNHWAGLLYVVHMASAYGAFALLGAAVLAGGDLPAWLGWLGVGWGAVFLAGFAATRFAGPFNPPFWAHCYTAGIGLALLLG